MLHKHASFVVGLSLFVALSGCLKSASGAPPAVDPQNNAAGRGYALLVGCTDYPSLDRKDWLEGPGNDVKVMRTLLVKNKFAEADIIVLSEAEGRRKGESYRPTRANIVRELETNFPRKVHANDQVVIHLSGHGSQQPDVNPNEDDPEPDGMDETFLPADIGHWNRQAMTVTNAIVDDELAKWIGKIADQGARVWLIVDSCNSGTMLRGDLGERAREIKPSDLGVPDMPLPQNQGQPRPEGRERARGADEDRETLDLPKSPQVVAIYAAQSNQPTIERSMPYNLEEGPNYGLFTYTMCDVLTQTHTPLSYRELARQILQRYEDWGRLSPIPFVEGAPAELDRSVMKSGTVPRFYDFGGGPGDYWISAGLLHGLTNDSVLAVYPNESAGDQLELLGYVRVIQAEPFRSLVEPCTEDGEDAGQTDFAKNEGRCSIVRIAYSDLSLPIAVDTQAIGTTPNQLAQLDAIRGDLENLVRQPRPRDANGIEQARTFRVVKDIRKAHWLIQAQNDQLVLVPTAAATPLDSTKIPAGTPTFPIAGPEPVRLIEGYMDKIFRGQNLLKISSMIGRGADVRDLTLELIRLGEGDREVAVIDPLTEPTFSPGQRARWRIKNVDRDRSYDVTLLYVESNFSIDLLFPRSNALSPNNTLDPGQAIEMSGKISDRSWGTEHAVLIASLSSGQPQDFRFLAAENLGQARGIAMRGGEDSLQTPFGQLCQVALFGAPKTRGINRDRLGIYSLQRRSLRVIPAAPAATGR